MRSVTGLSAPLSPVALPGRLRTLEKAGVRSSFRNQSTNRNKAAPDKFYCRLTTISTEAHGCARWCWRVLYMYVQRLEGMHPSAHLRNLSGL